MDYTDEQVDTAARAARTAWHRGREYPWEHVDSGTREDWRGAALAALTALEPAPAPELVTWTPSQGPLADALAGLPDGHKVTIRGDWGELHGQWTTCTTYPGHIFARFGTHASNRLEPAAGGITSASWRRPQPAWATPRPPLAVSCAHLGVKVRYPDGLYRDSDDVPGWTAARVDEAADGDVRVLIDADGKHTEEQK